MSGITGWVSFGQDLTIRHDVLATMTATLAPRGPDAGGMWTSEYAALGNRRLAVLDPANGAQPMSAGHATITYNGEVYNFQELRADLRRRGHRFTTGTDTEVVLRGYLEWGIGVAERLNGMFAFALWDARGQKLVLVRDRLGEKPLYYHPLGNGLLFGSEPQAIFAHPAARKEIDADGLRELFTQVRTPGHAVWKGMREVRPGTILIVDRSGLREHVYWRLETVPHLDDAEETAAEIDRLLQDTVARQLVSDVPIGVLPGSRAISALAAARDVPTISLPSLPDAELFRAVRDEFTVVLSGERFEARPERAPVLRPEVQAWLDLDTFVADSHAAALNEIARLPGEPDGDWELRKASYLHLTRNVRVLLDRVDRLSMAVGLEVRLPFADHRLVEYVHNALKTFDGKKKRAATADERHVAALREQVRQLTGDHPVFELVDRSRVDAAGRETLEQVLDLAAWLGVHRPQLVR